MKRLTIFIVSIFLLGSGLGTVFAQMKPVTPGLKQPKLPVHGKSYWCAKVEDILFPKEPQQGEKLSVGVRIKFRQETVIPGAPGQKLCDCAFEGPPGAPTKFWSKTMSIRLIGVKYSETETNFLEYYGPTPAFPTHDYSGFPVIGFVVTENDLKKGYIDLWGWASREPLQCRDAAIYASFAIYTKTPYNQQNECRPHSDFKKTFKPKCLPKVPEGTIEKIEKGAKIFLPPEKFLIKKMPPIKFVPFKETDFGRFINIKKLPDGRVEKIVRLKNGKELPFDKFIKEVNELEAEFNKMGISLRDSDTIKIKYIYPHEQLKLQKEMFSKDFSKGLKIHLPPQVVCEGDSEGHTQSEGGPKDFVPLDWRRDWNQSFGNDDFGINLNANMKIEGKEDSVDVQPYFDLGIKMFGKEAEVLTIHRKGNKLVGEVIGVGDLFEQRLSSSWNEQLFKEDFKWSRELSFPVGPINVSGEFGFNGNASLTTSGEYDLGSGKLIKIELTPYADAEAYGELGANYEIVTAGVGGKITLININAPLSGGLQLTGDEFKIFANGDIDANLLNGRLYAFVEIDYLIDSKKFEIEFFNFEGFHFKQNLFYIKQSVPSKKDHHAYLKIDKIYGITPYTARNEKLDIEPISYDLIVNIDGREYTKTLKDYNKSGIWGDAIGEYEDQIFEIPLLSYKRVPISLEVKEKYKIGTFEFYNTLDFAPGAWNKVELCYDPRTRTFSGTKSGKEDEEIRSVGDTEYWGERQHGILFEIGGGYPFKAAPAKAK